MLQPPDRFIIDISELMENIPETSFV